MIDTPVIPNRQIIRILPSVTDLQVMVLNNELHKPVQGSSALFLRQSVDLLDMVSNPKNGLPSCDWVCANHRMNGLQVSAHVLWGSTRFTVELETVLLGAEAKAGLCISGCKAFEELLVRLGKPIIQLIPRCPQSIYDL
jgi:hypothetical protein